MSKNNPLVAILDRHHIPYTLHSQSYSTRTIEETAQARGISADSMLKCVLMRDLDDQLYLACTRGTKRVIPQAVRSHFDCRRVTCVAPTDVESRCGYALGTVNPVLLPTSVFRVFDHHIALTESITISSGNPLLGIGIKYADLIELCRLLGHPVQVSSVR
ncbi:aminoacyl-tRNA deacylase [Vibrio ulleungensis]|uniref:YbaK/EbsC family protein n=1 Tax=Vibrio ulleungensis TaxID=2807619 RepID=A0ABS2HMK3_9VIBR|nr:YbaK/EbsC family protein [Vibrio ulleungensis]MBM7037911.1 YbaK/EbsC family protein [Vibrio ulleungensis]